jgi:transcriptional regulator with XRE-family HTH domain
VPRLAHCDPIRGHFVQVGRRDLFEVIARFPELKAPRACDASLARGNGLRQRRPESRGSELIENSVLQISHSSLTSAKVASYIAAQMSAKDIAGGLGGRVDQLGLGRRVAQARIDRLWSQSEVARRAGLSSIHRLSRIERGRCTPSLSEVVALTRVLEMDLVEAVLGSSRLGGSLQQTVRLVEELAPAEELAFLARLLETLINGYRRTIAEGMR